MTALLKKITGVVRRAELPKETEKLTRAISYLDLSDNNLNKAVDILLELKPDIDTVLAFLLIDVFLLDQVTDDQVAEYFGHEVLALLHSVKKLEVASSGHDDKKHQLETLKRMFLSMAKDIKVIVLLLIYRIYRLELLGKSEDGKVAQILAKESLGLYVPIASRLGIYTIKTKLEDLAFKYCNPSEYEDISKQMKELKESCNISIAYVQKELEHFFAEKKINAKVVGRLKSFYSVYKKLKKKGLTSVSDLYDIFAMRVILEDVRDKDGHEIFDNLYSTLGVIHTKWKPISRRFKDYIAVPKPNRYRSLHTVLLGLARRDAAQPVEVQIRSESMDRDAEYGIASHWLYKEQGVKSEEDLRSQVEWIKGLERIRQDLVSNEEMLKGLDKEAFSDRIFVLTPKGEVKDLPAGSVPIDFAYSVHTDVGNHCVMAKVDSHVVPLDYELKNGQVVEIVTKKEAVPRIQWLSMVKTGFAKNKIKAHFNKENSENNIKEGRRLMNELLEKIGKPKLDANLTILKNYLSRDLSLTLRESLLEEIGTGSKMALDVLRKTFQDDPIVLEKLNVGKQTVRKKSKILPGSEPTENLVLIGGEPGLPVKFASCCKPKYGKDIVGYVTRGSKITVHLQSCQLIKFLIKERFIEADWRD